MNYINYIIRSKTGWATQAHLPYSRLCTTTIYKSIYATGWKTVDPVQVPDRRRGDWILLLLRKERYSLCSLQCGAENGVDAVRLLTAVVAQTTRQRGTTADKRATRRFVERGISGQEFLLCVRGTMTTTVAASATRLTDGLQNIPPSDFVCRLHASLVPARSDYFNIIILNRSPPLRSSPVPQHNCCPDVVASSR